MAIFHRHCIAALVCALFLVGPVVAMAAVTPKISISDIRDFTRITFDWPEKVRFSVKETEQGVSLTFNKPSNIDLMKIRDGLAKKLTKSSVSKDGTRINLTFDAPYRVRHFISGNANGIDILNSKRKKTVKAKAKTTEPVKPVEAKKSEETVMAKADVPEKPAEKSKVEKKDESKEATTKKTVEHKAEATKSDADKKVLEAEKKVAEAEKKIAEAEKKVAEVEKKVAEAEKKAAEAPAVKEKMVEKTKPAVKEKISKKKEQPTKPVDSKKAEAEDLVDEEPIKAPKKPEIKAKEEPKAETPKEVVKESKPATAETKKEEPAKKEDSETAKTKEKKSTEVEKAEPKKEGTPVGGATKDVVKEEVSSDKTAKETPADEVKKESSPSEKSPNKTATETDDDTPFIVTTKSLPSGTEIRFPWKRRVAASVFFRGQTLWMVFGGEQEVNLTLLKSIMPASVSAVNQINIPGHTVITLETDGSVYAKVTRPKMTVEWWVTLSNYPQVPTKVVPLSLKADSRVPNVYMPVLEFSEPLTLKDPLVGDSIIVTPFYNPGEAVYPSRSFVEFDILQSAQGLAVVKKADLTKVTPLRNGLRIANKTGTSLSKDLPSLTTDELEEMRGEYSTLFAYDNWRVEPGEFVKKRQEIENEMLGANSVRKSTLRLKLAQLYLGAGLAHEASGILNIIRDDDYGFYVERKLAALHGAASFLKQDYNWAIEYFKARELRGVEEVQLWKDALAIFQRERPRFDYLKWHEAYIKKYPPLLREKLAILAADNYINRKSYSRALQTFDTLAENGVSDRTVRYIDYLLGKIAANSNKVAGAKQMWEPLAEQSDDRFIRARADFSLTAFLYNHGEIDLKEAIKHLDRLRIVWRGDTLELNLLNFLGELYIEDKNYLEGLRVWRELIRNYPDTPLATAVLRNMSVIFKKLFAEGAADELEPLQALSIFYEFRELSPIGEEGDAITIGLADRLASVDLLYRAAQLLEGQIKFRQEGESRSRLGAQLALTYLLNKEPQKALNTLELTNYGKNPYDLRRKRLQLTAMALSEIGEPERAIDMLSTDSSQDAKMLRLSTYWKMKDWPNVIESAEELLSGRPDVTAPLTDKETEYLLQLSIAYVFERDMIQLNYLRNYFSPLLQDNPNKEMFMFITDETGPINHEHIDQITKQISKIESFIETYRDRVSEGGLSSAIN